MNTSISIVAIVKICGSVPFLLSSPYPTISPKLKQVNPTNHSTSINPIALTTQTLDARSRPDRVLFQPKKIKKKSKFFCLVEFPFNVHKSHQIHGLDWSATPLMSPCLLKEYEVKKSFGVQCRVIVCIHKIGPFQ